MTRLYNQPTNLATFVTPAYSSIDASAPKAATIDKSYVLTFIFFQK